MSDAEADQEIVTIISTTSKNGLCYGARYVCFPSRNSRSAIPVSIGAK
ncbi:hypothetical protein GGP53_001837 [Salinibacter ruber]|nr:hypothetical protein [Salinibacter ruber]